MSTFIDLGTEQANLFVWYIRPSSLTLAKTLVNFLSSVYYSIILERQEIGINISLCMIQ